MRTFSGMNQRTRRAGSPDGAAGMPGSDLVSEASSGLYVHVPFCRSKCPYCDFFSVPSAALVPAWLRAVETEAQLYADSFGSFDTLYIGGGTPTVLGEDNLRKLVESLLRCFSLSGTTEITVEANPNDVTPGLSTVLRDLGVNRVSLGIQSLRETELRFLGRTHSVRDGVQAVEAIRAAGIHNLGLDLIYGLPGQTIGEWQQTLAAAIALAPEHISCYQLTLARGTPLAESMAAAARRLPGEEMQRRLFLTASQLLEARGYVHYEVSNFAKKRQGASPGTLDLRYPPDATSQPVAQVAVARRTKPLRRAKQGASDPEWYRTSAERAEFGDIRACRHNLKYWLRAPYLGLGPSAHSFQDRRRWWNYRSLEEYCDSLARHEPPVEGQESLAQDDERLERLALAWRTRAGISVRELGEPPVSAAVLGLLTKRRLVRRQGDLLVPTPEGYLVADRIPLLFP